MTSDAQGRTSGAEPVAPIALGVKAAAQAIGVSVSWLHHSDVPRVKLGARVLFLVSDLTAFLEARRSHGAAA